ncbi:MAG: AraC family transcriptional regulator [Bacteroidetes bacterium]|nr:AraC family transcriptional regulator [Bacteroidota bacterium]
MRARLENISTKMQGRSILGLKIDQVSFDSLWHYHPEYELTYIINGNGRRMVGDDMENFSDGDLVLLGPDLPHTWIGERRTNSENNRALVIQFSEEFIHPFLSLLETKNIHDLLIKSGNGIRFLKYQPIAIEKRMLQIIEDNSIKRVTGLLELLNDLSSKKYKTLASHRFKVVKSEHTESRLNKVLLYMQKNYRSSINLQEASKLIHLSDTAFCKFFKRSIGKTFSDYLNDLRILHACTQLIETDKPISQIATESGFENLAYFNRVFLKKKKMQPTVFRRR